MEVRVSEEFLKSFRLLEMVFSIDNSYVVCVLNIKHFVVFDSFHQVVES